MAKAIAIDFIPGFMGCARVAAGCLCDGVIEAVHSPTIAAGQQVPIDGQGKAGGVMADPLLNIRERLTSLDQQTRSDAGPQEPMPQKPGAVQQR